MSSADFMIVMYAAIFGLVAVFQIDLADYTPGPDGQSPTSGSAGLVKEAMFDMANEPALFWLAVPAVAIGAPLAEELVFRGQLFAALARSRAGFSGATLITSALWSLLHLTEPWLAIGIIFMMGADIGSVADPLWQPVGDDCLSWRLEWLLLTGHPWSHCRNEPADPTGGSGRRTGRL